MAFRKRNVAIGRSLGDNTAAPDGKSKVSAVATGVRPSPLTSHAVTSTGTPSLDGLMGGHAGLALGSSLLIEESGTTDYAGALLRYFAAEGICQGHVLHVVGVGEAWVRDLPGISEDKGRDKASAPRGDEEKMKIAWRYEKLGQASERAIPDRTRTVTTGDIQHEVPFCHTFDLTKRLVVPTDAKIHHIPITTASLENIIQSLSRSLSESPPHIIHRLIIPSLLSPALYPPITPRPENLTTFLLALRALLRRHSSTLVALLTLPLELHPRTSGTIHWAEILSDGVVELTPFPHDSGVSNPPSTGVHGGSSGSASGKNPASEPPPQPQGLVRIHKLPLATERGEGGAGANAESIGADLAFTVSRRKFAIAAFALPPMEGDREAQGQGQTSGEGKGGLEF